LVMSPLCISIDLISSSLVAAILVASASAFMRKTRSFGVSALVFLSHSLAFLCSQCSQTHTNKNSSAKRM
jgi:hypothetical protein